MKIGFATTWSQGNVSVLDMQRTELDTRADETPATLTDDEVTV